MSKLQEKANPLRLGIYLHVPFCARACDFCSFYQEAPKREDIERYLEGVEVELKANPFDRPVDTMFWGGGTPGLLPAADLERLGNALRNAMGNQPVEWTVEMAPATVKADKIRVLRDLGVNRISMGVQSFQPAMLEALGRIHALSQVDRAIDIIQSSGMDNLNLDLMFAIPGQTLWSWEADILEAAKRNPQHISTYCLTFEEDTALWVRLRQGAVSKHEPDDEERFYRLGWELLPDLGYPQYEISNFSVHGKECQHNLDTWRMQEWYGFGPSASGQVGLRRYTNPHSLDAWLEGVKSGNMPYVDETGLRQEDIALDALIFGLRMVEGVDLKAWRERFGLEVSPDLARFFTQLMENGLALRTGNLLTLTIEGRLVADRIGSELLACELRSR